MDTYFESKELYEESNKHKNPLRRPRFFPLHIDDIGDINDPSTEHYSGWDSGHITPSVHWTFLVEVVSFERVNFAGRPVIRCKDSLGHEFNVIGYFENRRNAKFDTAVAPVIIPGNTLAMRYAEKKVFMDLSTGIRLEDRHVDFTSAIPCSVDQLLRTADRMFTLTDECWATGCAARRGEGSGLMACGVCKRAVYCSKECQLRDWKAAHKHECKSKIIQWVLELAGQGQTPFSLDDFKTWLPFGLAR